jgi:hypothetical protein
MDYTIPVEFGKYLVLFAIGMLVLACIIHIIKGRTCADKSEKNYYEHFESPNDWSVSALRSRIDKIVNLKEALLKYTEDVGILADETCLIMKTVEDKYIMNASQLKDGDYEKSKAEQDRIVKQRQTLAKKRFAEQQSVYAAVNGQKPLLECFYADNEDVASAEAELNVQLNELEKIMDTAAVKAAILKKERAAMSLGFSMNYLNDAVKSLETPKVEGFFAELNGPQLIAKADKMIGAAASLQKELEDLRAQINTQNNMMQTMENKAKGEARGGNQVERATDMDRLAYL